MVMTQRALQGLARMILWMGRGKQIPRCARFLRQGKRDDRFLVLRRTEIWPDANLKIRHYRCVEWGMDLGSWETRSEKGTGLKTRRYNGSEEDRRGGGDGKGGACR